MQENKNAIFQMRFPQKLWYLLNLRTDAILWGGTGRTILLNYRILHNYLQCDHSIFKTTNISSFVRQLNLYGFRKVTSHLQDPLCNSSNPFMHEYVHDYFQYGRPEFLNKISRKAFTMKKNFKAKNFYGNASENLLLVTPLQKARRALRLAVRKAAQDLFIQQSPKEFNLNFEDATDDLYEDEEENIEFDWCININNEKNSGKSYVQTGNEDSTHGEEAENKDYRSYSQDSILNFNDESCGQNNENFSNQFLSMPELDAESAEDNSGVELLAEFNIGHNTDEGIVEITGHNKENDQNSLNCVLPSISNDQIYDISMIVKNNNDFDHYNGEWDQMFTDMMPNKHSGQECNSDLKDVYSQISRTMEMLNS